MLSNEGQGYASPLFLPSLLFKSAVINTPIHLLVCRKTVILINDLPKPIPLPVLKRGYFLTFITTLVVKQVWVAKENVAKKLEDIEIPFSDVKNVLEEIHFEDDATRSRCRGWLVLPSRRFLQADIMFPGCEFDCRLTIRGRTGMHKEVRYNLE